MIMLDTNIVIAYFDGEEKVISAVENAIESGETIALPTIVKAETLAYQNIDENTLVRMREWFYEVQLISLDSEIAEQSATLRRKTHLKLIDSVIATTALMNNAKLATRDEEFQRISTLAILQW